jgi:3-oxoadipate enol-lactonase
MPDHARRRHFTASANHDAWDALPRITAPTLAVHGTDDIFNPAANAPLPTDRIPRAHGTDRPARHASFDELRAVASPLVLTFVAD